MGQCGGVPSKKVKVNKTSSAMRELVKAIKRTDRRSKQGKVIAGHSLFYILEASRIKRLQQLCLSSGGAYCGMHARAVRITGSAKLAARMALKRTPRKNCRKLSQREFWKAVAKARKRFCTIVEPGKCTSTKRRVKVSQR